MRKFVIIYGGHMEFVDEQGLKNFVEVAVIHNKDIASFRVIDLDRRLTDKDALTIAEYLNIKNEVLNTLLKGVAPLEALHEHSHIWDR